MSLYGPVKSAWEIKGEDFTYEVTIPANTTASVSLPQAQLANLKVNSFSLSPEWRKKIKQTEEGFSLEFGSGSYQFSYPAAALK